MTYTEIYKSFNFFLIGKKNYIKKKKLHQKNEVGNEKALIITCACFTSLVTGGRR